MYDSAVKKLWDSFISEASVEDIFSSDFFMKEWERIIIPNAIKTKEQYRNISRAGMGYPLDRSKRDIAWSIIEMFYKHCIERGETDVNLACRRVADRLYEDGNTVYRYIIVDEVQDFSINKLRVISALSGRAHRDSIFLVGDKMQNIYNNETDMDSCGIDIADRKFQLRVNYRTTDEIARFASGLLGSENNTVTLSIAHAQKPEVLRAAAGDLNVLCPFLEQIQASKETLCIVTPKSTDRDNIRSFLTNRGFDITLLDQNTFAKNAHSCIATIHRIKGLEFDHIIIWGIENWIVDNIPCRFSSDLAASKEIERSRRHLAYVAATRARKGLLVIVIDSNI